MHQCGNCRRSGPYERIEYPVIFICHSQDESFYQLNGKLTWMISLLDVIRFYIRDFPHIAGILSQNIAGKLTSIRAFEVFFAGIFLRHAHRIEVECVCI